MTFSRTKFFIKWTLMGFLQRVFVFFFGARANKNGWEDRVLIVDLHGIGDVILATPTLRYYRKHFAGKKIYLLVAAQAVMAQEIFGDDIDVLLTADSRKFGLDPRYALQTINRLRRIGFSEVINECLGIKEKASRVISISLGAERVIGYEGPGVELANPTAAPYDRYARKHIFPHYTTLVASVDKGFLKQGTHPAPAISQHLAICKTATGFKDFPDTSVVFRVDSASVGSAKEKLAKLGAAGKPYVVMVPGASDPAKFWEIGKFAAVAQAIHDRGFEIVLSGSPSERFLAEKFSAQTHTPFIDAIGELSIVESAAVIQNAYCLVTNDTAPVHIAVALGVPSICITFGAHLYMNSLYGRKNINRWVYRDIGCLYDDWQCLTKVPPGSIVPCLAAVPADDVVKEFASLEDYLKKHPRRNEPFVATFGA